MNNRVGTAQFVEIAAATQFQGPGALITDDYQKEITDILRRNSVLDGRIKYVPATATIKVYPIHDGIIFIVALCFGIFAKKAGLVKKSAKLTTSIMTVLTMDKLI